MGSNIIEFRQNKGNSKPRLNDSKKRRNRYDCPLYLLERMSTSEKVDESTWAQAVDVGRPHQRRAAITTVEALMGFCTIEEIGQSEGDTTNNHLLPITFNRPTIVNEGDGRSTITVRKIGEYDTVQMRRQPYPPQLPSTIRPAVNPFPEEVKKGLINARALLVIDGNKTKVFLR